MIVHPNPTVEKQREMIESSLPLLEMKYYEEEADAREYVYKPDQKKFW